jgi:hypothetical protein
MGTVTYIEGHLHDRVDFALEKEALPRIGERLAALFDPPTPPDRSGLFVATANAGFRSSLSFWSEAQRAGVGLANPELFPWCLANAPGGWLARRFHLTGPNATYLGEADALLAAIGDAHQNLLDGRIDAAWVVVLIFAQEPGQIGEMGAVRLTTQPLPLRLRAAAPTGKELERLTDATTSLFAILDRLEMETGAEVLSDGHTAFSIER